MFGAQWTSPSSGFTDIISDFEDGVEKIDLRESGLAAGDITITDDGFAAIITATAGRIEVSGLAGQITTDAISSLGDLGLRRPGAGCGSPLFFAGRDGASCPAIRCWGMEEILILCGLACAGVGVLLSMWNEP